MLPFYSLIWIWIWIQRIKAGLDGNGNYESIEELIYSDSSELTFPGLSKKSILGRFLDKSHQSFKRNSLTSHVLQNFNKHLVPKLKSKEAWLQVLAMNIIYLDTFVDNVPPNLKHWEIHRKTSHSLLNHDHDDGKQDQRSKPVHDIYILKEDEWGKGGREHYGMKAQFWTSKDPTSSSKNIIVFRGTVLIPTNYSSSIKLGNGLLMDFDKDGIGKTAFALFVKDFMNWIEVTKAEKKDLIITGHSLGGTLAMRLHAHLVQNNPEWALASVESIVFNSPGLDDSTASLLDGNPKHQHVFNDGDFFPHWFTQPETNHFVHQLINSNSFSFQESIELHKYPGLASLESRNVPIHVDSTHNNPQISRKKDEKFKSKNPQVLKKNLVEFKKRVPSNNPLKSHKKEITRSLLDSHRLQSRNQMKMMMSCQASLTYAHLYKRSTIPNCNQEWRFISYSNGKFILSYNSIGSNKNIYKNRMNYIRVSLDRKRLLKTPFS